MEINETEINLVAEGTELEGKLAFTGVTRIQGRIRGEVKGLPGSEIVLGEHGLIEGSIQGEQIWIDGTVLGEIRATERITLSRTGRVFGSLIAPKLSIEFGAYFEGESRTTGKGPQGEAAHVPA